MLHHTATMAPILKNAEERQQRILDANYSAVDIDKYVAEVAHITIKQRLKLPQTLNTYPKLFQGDSVPLRSNPST